MIFFKGSTIYQSQFEWVPFQVRVQVALPVASPGSYLVVLPLVPNESFRIFLSRRGLQYSWWSLLRPVRDGLLGSSFQDACHLLVQALLMEIQIQLLWTDCNLILFNVTHNSASVRVTFCYVQTVSVRIGGSCRSNLEVWTVLITSYWT